MGLDKALAFLVLASVIGALIFFLAASSEYLVSSSQSARGRMSNSSSIDIPYNTPSALINPNSNHTPIHESDGDTLFFEKRMSDSEYAHLEDERQFGQR